MTVYTALMNFFISNHGFSQTNSPYTILKPGKSTIFIGEMPNCLLFQKVQSMMAQNVSTLYHPP